MNLIITGASRGIGAATALSLVQSGHKVLAIARSKEGLLSLHNATSRFPGELLPFAYDITNPDISGLLERVEQFGYIDGLLNNAGILLNKPFTETTDEEWTSTFQTNLMAPIRLIRTLLPYFNPEGRPHIVNIGSMGGYQGSAKYPGLSVYSCSKAALACLTEVLAEELKATNISVNCLAPGAVQTEMLATAFPGYKAPVTDLEMGVYVAHFLAYCSHIYNGKVLPVSVTTP